MKESPRTVSAIIIVVIVAAAIYAFSGNNQNQNSELAENNTVPPEATASPEVSVTPTPTPAATGAPEQKKDDAAMEQTPAPKAMTPVDKNALMEKAKSFPAEKTADNAYVETAQKGEGLTHLARRAATRYLSNNDAGYAVTNEHRIYIEDYVRKQITSHPVAIGSEETISFDLVKEAIESAKGLNERQLQNLTKYTHALR